MNNKHWILKLATSLILLLLFQTGHSASLMEIYNLAVDNDPQYKAAIANLAAAEDQWITQALFETDFPALRNVEQPQAFIF